MLLVKRSFSEITFYYYVCHDLKSKRHKKKQGKGKRTNKWNIGKGRNWDDEDNI